MDLEQHLNQSLCDVQCLKLEGERLGIPLRDPTTFINHDEDYGRRLPTDVFDEYTLKFHGGKAADVLTRVLEDLSMKFQLEKRANANGDTELVNVLRELGRDRDWPVVSYLHDDSTDCKVYLGQECLLILEDLIEANTAFKAKILTILAQRCGLDKPNLLKIIAMLKDAIESKSYNPDNIPEFLQQRTNAMKLWCRKPVWYED